MNLQSKIDEIKQILLSIKTEEDKERAKEKLKKILGTVTPIEIGIIEQELIRQGVSPYTIAEVCNAHVEIFKDFIIEDKSLLELPPGHPLHTLLEESKIALREAEKLTIYASILRQRKNLDEEEKKNLQRILIGLFGLKNHFGKLQLLVFPYLERRGLTAIPRVLWIRQDRLIGRIKLVLNKLNEDKLTPELLDELARDIIDMVERENRILYPLLNKLLSPEEWYAIKLEEENIGHYGVEPQPWDPGVEPKYPFMLTAEELTRGLNEALEKLGLTRIKLGEIDTSSPLSGNRIILEHGFLTAEEVNAILKTLPFDISFVGKDDRLKYYSAGGERIFPRAKTVLDRPVQYCHPPRSINIVKQIIEDFKTGKRDHADFWINMRGRLVLIRYFPVRNDKGEYLGTLEVVQDITDIKKIEGEKRILD